MGEPESLQDGAQDEEAPADPEVADLIRVVVVDDHTVYRRGLQTVLAIEPGILVVGEASDGIEATDVVAELLPDVVVLDVGMPKRGGIEACRIIREQNPSAKVLMLTSSDDDATLFEAVRAGASGYLLKDVAPDEVATGVRAVHQGQSLLSPTMAAKLLQEFAKLSHPPQPTKAATAVNSAIGTPRLTERELGILTHVARGRFNREIAAELHISENTVRNHIRNILDKLQMHSRMEAAMYAVREHLINPEG